MSVDADGQEQEGKIGDNQHDDLRQGATRWKMTKSFGETSLGRW